MVEFRDPGDGLVGACLADRLGDGLSAVYSFFVPGQERRSIGTYTILWLIDRARAMALPYVYLGYWVPESHKMAYKARFRPSEVLVSGTWRTLTDVEADATGRKPAVSALVPETTA
jgi:arginine-tRNA-protein transferase